MISGVHQLALPVTDLDGGEAFYRDVLGLPLIARFDPPGLVFFDLDGPRLLLDGSATDVAASAGLVYLTSDDLDGDFARLQASGAELLSEPHLVHRDDTGTFGHAGDEEWMMFFRDPDGHVLALVERRQAR